MRTFITIIGLALIVGTAFSACDNPLLTQWGITPEAAPIMYTGAFCKDLADANSAKSCCSAATINMAQTKQDEFKTKLTEIAKGRDQQIVQCVKQIVPQLQKAVDGVNNGINEVKGSPDQTKQQQGQTMQSKAAPYVAAAQQVVQNADGLKAQFGDYQKKRATCYATILDIAGSSFCLACAANWDAAGVNQDGSINIGTDLCTRLKDDCFDFLRASLKQGPLVGIKKVAGALNAYRNMTQDLQDKPRDGNVGGEAMMPKPPMSGQMGGQQPPPPGGQQQQPPPPQSVISGLMTPTSDGTLSQFPGGDPAGAARKAVGQGANTLGTLTSQSGATLKAALQTLITNVKNGLADAKAKLISSGFETSLSEVVKNMNTLSTTLDTTKTAVDASNDPQTERNALSQAFQQFKTDMENTATKAQLQAQITISPTDLAANALSAASNYKNVPNGADGIPPIQTGFVPDGPAQQEPKTPEGCDTDQSKATCNWLCQNIIDGKTGKINLKAFGVGGIPNEDAQALPPSTPVGSGSRRVLVTSGVTSQASWNPARGNAGTTASFDENPGGVTVEDEKKSATNLVATLFTAIMMAFAYIMI